MAKTSKANSKKQAASTSNLSDDGRRSMIEEAAYYKAEQRGFTPGHEDQDWIEAEKDVAMKVQSS